MTTTRTIYLPIDPQLGAGLRWDCGKDPGDTLPFYIEASDFLTEINDGLASVVASVLQARPGDLVIRGARVRGTRIEVMLTAGWHEVDYDVAFLMKMRRGGVASFTASVLCRRIRADKIYVPPLTPLTVLPGAGWFNSLLGLWFFAPQWGALPTAQPDDASAFWLDRGFLHISPVSTLLPSTPQGLGLGELWNNAGVVMSAVGNPGLPLFGTPVPDGTVTYDNGMLVVFTLIGTEVLTLGGQPLTINGVPLTIGA